MTQGHSTLPIDQGTTHKSRILVVEDDHSLQAFLTDELQDGGMDVQAVTTAEEAERRLIAWAPDLIVSDLRLPDAQALDLLRIARSGSVAPGFIVITAFGSVPQAVEALKAGADDFLTKPLDLDHLMVSITRTLETRRLRTELSRFRQLLGSESFHGLIGRSAPMLELFEQIRRIAGAAGPVLIIGESGVGKELVAHALHRESTRRDKPFLAVNCVAIPEHLMESELFGHTAGAFTGAGQARKGLFTESEGGTLLLDEIAEMPLSMQAKLLRVLQDGSVRPLGSNREHQANVRVVAATNRDLKTEVGEGRFREDLYYRLETFTLHIPPLRNRGEDIGLLTQHFLERFSLHMHKQIHELTPQALQRLKDYPFPGNVRELRNAMERAVTFCQGPAVSLEHLPSQFRGSESVPSTGFPPEGLSEDLLTDDELVVPLPEMEQRYIRFVLSRTGGNKRRAAALLGISRRTLYRRLGETTEDEEGS